MFFTRPPQPWGQALGSFGLGGPAAVVSLYQGVWAALPGSPQSWPAVGRTLLEPLKYEEPRRLNQHDAHEAQGWMRREGSGDSCPADCITRALGADRGDDGQGLTLSCFWRWCWRGQCAW